MSESLEDKIIKALEDGRLDTLSVSKKVIGKSGTKAQVNPTLYAMEKKGVLVHEQIGNIHIWGVPTGK